MKEKKIQVLNEFKLGCCIRQISKLHGCTKTQPGKESENENGIL